MAWIESHQTLGRHPKTLRLAAVLRCRVPEAVGLLQYLWWWALDYAPDGLVHANDKTVVARACLWHGKSERFWDGLQSAGFVEQTDIDNVMRIHDWMEYAGRLVDKRAANAERMRNARAAHVQRTSGARAGATVPNPTGQYPTDAAAAASSRVRARDGGGGGGKDFQSLGTLLRGSRETAAAASAADYAHLPDEVRERLQRPPIGSDVDA